jgi:hypothetical protein
MNGDYSHNHYVPVWYQRRFMQEGQSRYWYLDLRPDRVERDGHTHVRRSLLHWGRKSCFAQDDLYTVKWGNWINVDIERHFFGRIDREGRRAVEYFTAFDHDGGDRAAFQQLLTYMSVQKLRTPKGLAWLADAARSGHRNLDLILLQEIQNIYCAIWTECVWQIADASQSPTKFIVSDHPVTVYNRVCFPLSRYCTGFNDPDIRMVGTHTYFPLSLEKILILTNLAWVRNPYQSELRFRPNPNFFRGAIFNYLAIQLGRMLTEEEVRQINLITKKRAYRYIAAAEEEWLYPERFLQNDHWRKLVH